MEEQQIFGYLRSDGRKGIRNIVAIAYLVECARFVAEEIASFFREQPVHVIGFGGCYPNEHADKVMSALCRHPNVGAVLLLSLGCESFNKPRLYKAIEATGRPVHLITIQQAGGTRTSILEGRGWVATALDILSKQPRAPMGIDELIVGTICGGSDATSGITANPAVGIATDRLVAKGGTVLFEETGEMIGLEKDMAARAVTKELGVELYKAVEKAARYYTIMGHGSFAPGNADGGLSTIEEKSVGAYSKSGHSAIAGMVKPGDVPPYRGLYLLDVVPDGEPRFGFPNINDSAEIAELMACGCHIILFTTGRGSVVGSALAPVIKICANPETFQRLREDMDVNAGRLLGGEAGLGEIADEIIEKITATAQGAPTCSEALGHREFVLSYKRFGPLGPSCLPQ
ncbi:MAG TPA: UxaA family hydrolase [Puia sp.]|jgi:altronate dehydratase large subunit|nr:UxaA family hydrolase [Puia sp.]